MSPDEQGAFSQFHHWVLFSIPSSFARIFRRWKSGHARAYCRDAQKRNYGKAAAMLGTRWSGDRMSHRPAQYVRRRKAKGGNCPRAFPWGRGLFLPMNRLAISMRKQGARIGDLLLELNAELGTTLVIVYAQLGTWLRGMDPQRLSCEREPCMKRFCHD